MAGGDPFEPFDFDEFGVDQSLPSSAKERFKYQKNWESRLRKLRKFHRLHQQHEWNKAGSGAGQKAQTRYSKPPRETGVKGKLKRAWYQAKEFFGGSERYKKSPTRAPQPSRGSSTGRPDAPDGKRGFFDPPKRTTPSAGARNRLSGLKGRQQTGKRGGIHGGFGGSGVSGVKSSYHARSVLYTARDMRSRIRLTSTGFWALEISRLAEDEMQSLNREVAKPIEEGGLGAHGGIMAADTKDLDKRLGGISAGGKSFDVGGAMLRRSSNLLLGSIFSLAQMATLANPMNEYTNSLSMIDYFLGGEGTKGGTLKRLEGAKLIMNAWAEGGQAEADKMAGIIATFGTPEAKQEWEAEQARWHASQAMREKFYRDAASDVAHSVQGVSGKMILRALVREGKTENKLMRKAQVHGDDEALKFHMKRQNGTKE